jgi:enoyl-CoA hydratase/carnithine racemase
MSGEGPVRVTEHSPAYWTATLDAPPLNLFGPETHAALRRLLDRIEASEDLRVVVFDSAVPGYFIAHFDLARGMDAIQAEGAAPMTEWPQTMHRFATAPVLTVGKVRGRARGIGSEFLLALDIRYASLESAVLGQPEVGVGLVPGSATSALPPLVGRSRALEITIGAGDYDAATAERFGWVTRAVADADLDTLTDTLARRVASFDRAPIAEVKASVNRAGDLAPPAQVGAMGDVFRRLTQVPATRDRIAKAFELGIQQPGDFESDMGARLPGLAPVPAR